MKRRLIVVSGVLILFVMIIAFMNYQSDDEVYFGASEYTGAPEEADFSEGVITVDDTTGLKEGDLIAETPEIHIDAGRYILDVDHQNDTDLKAVISDGSTELMRITLPHNESNTRIDFTAEKNLYNLKISYTYSGNGSATIKRSILYSASGAFYSDTIIYAILIIFGICVSVYLIIKTDIFNSSIENKVCILSIVAFLLLVNYMYYRPFPVTAEDTRYHAARIEATYNEMREGQFPIVLYSDFVQGKGMIGIMYPYLFLFIPALLRAMHMSPEGALRLFFILISYATCATSYFASKRIMKNRYMATISMMLYGMLIYRITTMTYRYAYGELQAFVFFPLVIWGLYEILIGDKNKWIVLSLGMTGLMQCHILSFVQAVGLCVVLAVFFAIRVIREKRIVQVLYAALVTLLLNLWYIIPFVTYYREDLGIHDHLSWGKEIYSFSYYLTEMLRLFPNMSEGETQHKIGLIGLWLVLLTAISICIQIKNEDRKDEDKFATILLLFGMIILFMASKTFPWITAMKIDAISRMFEYLQFVGRFYMMGEILLLFGGMTTIAEYNPNRKKTRWIVPMLASFVVIAVTQAYLVSDGWLSRYTDPFDETCRYRYTPGINETEVEDYVPEGYWFGEGVENRAISPEAEISSYSHDHLHTSFVYNSAKPTYVDIPVLYYKGYVATAGNDTEITLEKGDNGCIRITLPATQTETTVNIDFVGFAIWKYATIISIVTGIVLVYCFTSKLMRKS